MRYSKNHGDIVVTENSCYMQQNERGIWSEEEIVAYK
jgi:hypothetical protein